MAFPPPPTPTHLFDQVITVKRRTTSAGAAGGVSNSVATHLSSVAARVQPQGGSEPGIAGRDRTTIPTNIYVDGALDIVAKDIVVWGSKTLEVIAVRDNQGQAFLKKLICEEANP